MKHYLLLLSLLILILGALTPYYFTLPGFWVMFGFFFLELLSFDFFKSKSELMELIFFSVALVITAIAIIREGMNLVSFGIELGSAFGALLSIIAMPKRTTKEEEAMPEVEISEMDQGGFVAKKNGKVYHTTECLFGKRIKPENAVFFNSKEEAEKKGLKAHNCVPR